MKRDKNQWLVNKIYYPSLCHNESAIAKHLVSKNRQNI